MAYNVGFAQVTVTPTFKGMQTAIKSEIQRTFPKAGEDAGDLMAGGINRKLDSPEIGETGKKMGTKAGGGMMSSFAAIGSKVFAPLVAAFAAINFGQMVADSISGASDLQQAKGAAETVFGAGAAAVKQNAATAAKAQGLSTRAYLESANLIGAQLQNKLGLEGDELAGETDRLMSQAADLAATYGGTTEEAVSALTAAMRGEYEQMERYGVSVNAAAIDQELAAKGLDGLTGKALDAAKAQAGLDIITQQTAKTQGQFASESDTLAGAQARLSSSWTNFKDKVGTALLPVLTSVTNFIAEKVLPALESFAGWITGTLVPAVSDFWTLYVKPVWENISTAIQTAWTIYIKPAFEAIWDFITNTLVPLFVGFYENVIKPVWEGIKFAIEVAWKSNYAG